MRFNWTECLERASQVATLAIALAAIFGYFLARCQLDEMKTDSRKRFTAEALQILRTESYHKPLYRLMCLQKHGADSEGFKHCYPAGRAALAAVPRPDEPACESQMNQYEESCRAIITGEIGNDLNAIMHTFNYYWILYDKGMADKEVLLGSICRDIRAFNDIVCLLSRFWKSLKDQEIRASIDNFLRVCDRK